MKARVRQDLAPATGWSKAETASVVAARVNEQRLLVDGINVVKKHARPNPMKGVTGGIVEKSMPIDQSNVMLFNPATGKGDRVGFRILEDGTKVRFFKSNGEQVKA